MVTKVNTNDRTCCLCGKTYTNPILLSPCGHSFDRECILQYTNCPVGYCNAPVFGNSLLPKNILGNLIDLNNETDNRTYEMFLLDTSTSMWYSDFFISLIGISRFQTAINFLTKIFEQRWNSTANRISLITFDTNPIERFPFEIAREHHLKILQSLQPNGRYTALFDAIKFCLEKFEKLNQITTRCTAQCLYILTDGGDNFSSGGVRQHYVNYVKEYSRKLNITGHFIQVGDKNLVSSKQLSDELDYRFHHFNNGNVPQFVNSFISSTYHYAQNLEKNINALPDACTTPVRPIVNQRKVGVLT